MNIKITADNKITFEVVEKTTNIVTLTIDSKDALQGQIDALEDKITLYTAELEATKETLEQYKAIIAKI